MHHPTDRITHTTTFVTPVVEHWLERETAQWVHQSHSPAATCRPLDRAVLRAAACSVRWCRCPLVASLPPPRCCSPRCCCCRRCRLPSRTRSACRTSARQTTASFAARDPGSSGAEWSAGVPSPSHGTAGAGSGLEVDRKLQTVMDRRTEGRKEMFYVTTHSTHFIYGYMA